MSNEAITGVGAEVDGISAVKCAVLAWVAVTWRSNVTVFACEREFVGDNGKVDKEFSISVCFWRAK